MATDTGTEHRRPAAAAILMINPAKGAAMSDVDVLPQYLITYLDQKGNRVAYDTAYTSEHRQTGVGRCVHRKGTKNEVKAMEEDVFSKRHSGETRDF